MRWGFLSSGVKIVTILTLAGLSIDAISWSGNFPKCTLDLRMNYLFGIIYIWSVAIISSYWINKTNPHDYHSFFRKEYKFITLVVFAYFIIRMTIEIMDKGSTEIKACFPPGGGQHMNYTTLIFWLCVGHIVIFISIVDYCTNDMRSRVFRSAIFLQVEQNDERAARIGLSESEIDRLPERALDTEERQTLLGADCCICLNEFKPNDQVRSMPQCNHTFHKECIDSWLRSTSNCPMCRDNVRPGSILGGNSDIIIEEHEEEDDG
mmetsp:Transcript_10121/g.11044  ORF Transcript_10121/g.11044 Transcript_10121/m.11044 type:complete len:264 (-) Transcript_10121:34-825(-)